MHEVSCYHNTLFDIYGGTTISDMQTKETKEAINADDDALRHHKRAKRNLSSAGGW
jgi:hypothetical protein